MFGKKLAIIGGMRSKDIFDIRILFNTIDLLHNCIYIKKIYHALFKMFFYSWMVVKLWSRNTKFAENGTKNS